MLKSEIVSNYYKNINDHLNKLKSEYLNAEPFLPLAVMLLIPGVVIFPFSFLNCSILIVLYASVCHR